MKESSADPLNSMASETKTQENILTFTVPDELLSKRADVVVSECGKLTRSYAQGLFDDGKVKVNGISCKKNYKAGAGDVFEVLLPEVEISEVLPEDIPLDICFEDDDVIVVNKPQGMVVHPAPGHCNGTLVSALLFHCKDSLSDINGVIRPGIVHRIDRDTSGLIAVAKNNKAHLALAAQLEDHSMARVYYAIVHGRLNESGTVNAPIDRHPVDRKKMAVVKSCGRNAVTHYEALEELPGYTFAKMRLETGRTHQIRVHLAHIGHPVLFDPVYGRVSQFEKQHPGLMNGQCLHAGELCFTHPSTGEKVSVKAPLPDYFEKSLNILRNKL